MCIWFKVLKYHYYIGTGLWNDLLHVPGPEGRNIHKFDYISEPVC